MFDTPPFKDSITDILIVYKFYANNKADYFLIKHKGYVDYKAKKQNK